MRSHFLGVVGVQHPSGFVLLVSCVAEAAALASVPGAGPQRRAVPLQRHSDTGRRRSTTEPGATRSMFPTGTRTCEELSSSAACDEAERKASDWLREETLQRAFSNLPRPRLCGGDVSESLATPSSSSEVEEKQVKKNKIFVHVWRLIDV